MFGFLMFSGGSKSNFGKNRIKGFISAILHLSGKVLSETERLFKALKGPEHHLSENDQSVCLYL